MRESTIPRERAMTPESTKVWTGVDEMTYLHRVNKEDCDLFVESAYPVIVGSAAPVPSSAGAAHPGRTLSNHELREIFHWKAKRGWRAHSIIGEVKRFGFRQERKGQFQQIFEERDLNTYHRLVDSAMAYINPKYRRSGHGRLAVRT